MIKRSREQYEILDLDTASPASRALATNGTLQVQTTAQIEITIVGHDGERETRLLPATTMVSGDEVI